MQSRKLSLMTELSFSLQTAGAADDLQTDIDGKQTFFAVDL